MRLRRQGATYCYLCVRKYGVDMEASGAFNIHKETIRRLYESLQLMLTSLVSL